MSIIDEFSKGLYLFGSASRLSSAWEESRLRTASRSRSYFSASSFWRASIDCQSSSDMPKLRLSSSFWIDQISAIASVLSTWGLNVRPRLAIFCSISAISLSIWVTSSSPGLILIPGVLQGENTKLQLLEQNQRLLRWYRRNGYSHLFRSVC